MVKSFYVDMLKNLESKEVFYKYYKKSYSYNDLKTYYLKFLNLIKKSSIKRYKICILSEKSFDLYASSLSAILSNNIWVPISETLPKERVFQIINQVNPDIFIIDKINNLKKKNIRDFLKKKKIKLVLFKDIRETKESNKIKNIEFKSKETAMIFFTSGSAGKPKGVMISHKSYIHCLKEQLNKLHNKNSEKLIFGDYHDISFVISLNILLPCFCLKGTISPAIEKKDIIFPIEHLNKNNINTLITVPTFINRIRYYYKQEKKKIKLDTLILCGEPFYINLLEFLYKNKFSKKIFNCYGSTELSPWVFFHKCNYSDIKKYKRKNLVPIGKSFRSIKSRIIDNQLYIGGPTLCQGYLDKSQDKNTFKKINGKKYYKTNDIVFKNNKTFFIKGRSDSIVKVYGYRIELFEIDHAIRGEKQISNCFVFVKNISQNEKIIYAAIEAKKINIDNLFAKLKKKLPSYMLPKEIIVFKKFPVNKSGKTDRVKISSKFEEL